MSTEPGGNQSSTIGLMIEPVRWLHFLPRWSLLVAVTSLSLTLIYLAGFGGNLSDNTLGLEYIELLQAVRSPQLFRLVWAIDALIWLMLGVSLMAFAGLLRGHSALRATFISACGFAQLFGVLGSFIRLDGIGDLATDYLTSAADNQAMVLESFLSLLRVINASNQIGVILQGVGFLLVAGGVFSLHGFPKWVAIWLFIPGILALTQFYLFIIGADYVFILNVLGLVIGNIGLNLAIAFTLWQPRSDLITAVGGENVGD